MSNGFDRIYRNAIAAAAHTAVEESWTEVREAVTAWKNDASTPTAWATYLDALYGYAETNRNACSSAYVAEVAATAAAQKTLDIATAAAYRDYLTDSAATVNTAEK
ncbi:MAG: hypothetical protein J6X44_11305, partial [Thermoguttaceae bacterium]|nr:hypothetical protein [Thermoguttaceae bacterium]